jgi:pimeloyl-ACP methyl ester carboxylesterase
VRPILCPALTLVVMLEVIDKGAAGAAHPVPLLFVHGAWHAAWCWDEHFLDFFADRGFRAVAVSFRGHGNSSTSKRLRDLSFADYVEDVTAVARTLPTPPVVIGHSMGGVITQLYLAGNLAPAAALMCSMPPQGYLRSGLRWMRRHPWHFAKLSVSGESLPYVSTPELARERFFSPGTPEDLVRRYAARLQEESARCGLDGLVKLPRPGRVSAPVLVMGASQDGAVTPAEVRATARAYRTDPVFFDGMGHDMMLEPGWMAVAERLENWLLSRGF